MTQHASPPRDSTDKVPPAVVEQERQRLADWTAQREALQSQRAKL